MKNFMLGILFTISLASIANYHWINHGRFEKLAFSLNNSIIEGNYLIHPLTGRCNIELYREYLDIDGTLKKQSEADYFQCDKFQRLINLE